MKLSALLLSATLLTACASNQRVGDAYGTSVAGARQCPTCAASGVGGKQALEWMKSLGGKNGQPGRWVAHTDGKDGKPTEMVVTYKTVSAGSAVCETIAPGTSYEMVTMYHLDGDRLTATHYCAMGNQPRMQAVVCACDPARKTASFKFLDGTNMVPAKDNFMGNQDYTFTGPDTLTIQWHHLGPGGKPDGQGLGGDFKRVM
ncbi:MAG: hypothetical protein K2Q09_05980 [Phycisphaerales bacterium]|nr:hypothetical protein [Phycisphaerales bacterium]